MRVAPPVQARSSGAGPWLRLQQLLVALSTAVLAFWAGSRLLDATAWLLLGSLALGVGAALLAGRALGATPRVLRWDGASWTVDDDGHGRRAGQVAVMLDLGRWMLVRFTAAEPGMAHGSTALWLAFSGRGEGRADWSALRVALYAPPPPAAARAAGAAPAGPDAG
jgi:hypothetical protein